MIEIISAEEARKKSLYTDKVQKFLENLNVRILKVCAQHAKTCIVNIEWIDIELSWEDIEAIQVILEDRGYVVSYIDGMLEVMW